ncbi:MAG: GTPase ObgE [Candidatus Kapaibacterium sp.]
MKFIDTAKIYVKSGDGGDGHVSFRKEKYVPKGGPDGGNGGKGGDVIFKASRHINTLIDFYYKRHYPAEDGLPGGKARKTGKSGKDAVIKVPVGTVVYDDNTGEALADLSSDGQKEILAKGGNGGFGNAEFATPTNRAPRHANPGQPGTELELRLELKLLADVGLVGFPNAGKSTLISTISAAKPKIAEYPFTTLIPNLGVVRIDESKSFVVADIPGLIQGASEGKGLGIQFLRHVERTAVLVFLIESISKDPVNDYAILKNELETYNPEMAYKSRIICISKSDIIHPDKLDELQSLKFPGYRPKPMIISSATMQNMDKLKFEIWKKIEKVRENQSQDT